MKTLFLLYMILGAAMQLGKKSDKIQHIHDVDIVFYIIVMMMFLPEILFVVNKKFRSWLKQGIEDSDNKFEKSDISDLVGQLAAMWCVRVFVIASFFSIFRGVKIPDLILTYSFFGSIGIEGIMFLKNFMKLKNE